MRQPPHRLPTILSEATMNTPRYPPGMKLYGDEKLRRDRQMVEAVRAQLDRFAHVCFPVSTYEPYVELAERMNRVTPGDHEKRTFFVNSGAEAVMGSPPPARIAHFDLAGSAA